jgi:hypothetical protein
MALKLVKVAKYAESLMVDRCIVWRYGRQEDTVTGNWDEASGKYIPNRVNRDIVYEGKCMIYSRQNDATPTEEGGGTVAQKQLYSSLPRSADWPILPEDELVIVNVGPDSDVSLIGNAYLMEAIDQGTYLATREVSLIDRSKVKRT